MANPLQVQNTRFSEPSSHINGRKNQMLSTEGIGGSTRINALLWTRGAPGGYDEWATGLGLDEWTWCKVEPYFRRLENSLSHKDSPERGHDGAATYIPTHVRGFVAPWHALTLGTKDLFPCNTSHGLLSGLNSEPSLPASDRDVIINWCILSVDQAAKRLGLPLGQDCNSPSASSMGLFDLEMTIHPNGRRASAYNTYLNKKLALSRRQHLTICTGVVVSKLDVDEQAGLVRGVHFQSRGKNPGPDVYVRARREVIVCSGALGTPQILLLSGIGPRSQLDALMITVKKDLPVRTVPKVSSRLSVANHCRVHKHLGRCHSTRPLRVRHHALLAQIRDA
jgi:choline dehydrogenase-like flavoprotein